MHTSVGALEIPAKMLGKSFNSGLGCVIGGVARRIGDSLLATGNNDGSRLRLGGLLDHREEGSNAMDNAENVGFKNLISSG